MKGIVAECEEEAVGPGKDDEGDKEACWVGCPEALGSALEDATEEALSEGLESEEEEAQALTDENRLNDGEMEEFHVPLTQLLPCAETLGVLVVVALLLPRVEELGEAEIEGVRERVRLPEEQGVEVEVRVGQREVEALREVLGVPEIHAEGAGLRVAVGLAVGRPGVALPHALRLNVAEAHCEAVVLRLVERVAEGQREIEGAKESVGHAVEVDVSGAVAVAIGGDSVGAALREGVEDCVIRGVGVSFLPVGLTEAEQDKLADGDEKTDNVGVSVGMLGFAVPLAGGVLVPHIDSETLEEEEGLTLGEALEEAENVILKLSEGLMDGEMPPLVLTEEVEEVEGLGDFRAVALRKLERETEGEGEIVRLTAPLLEALGDF